MNTTNQPFKKGAQFLLNIKINTTWRIQFIWMVLKTNVTEKLSGSSKQKEPSIAQQSSHQKIDRENSRLKYYYE